MTGTNIGLKPPEGGMRKENQSWYCCKGCSATTKAHTVPPAGSCDKLGEHNWTLVGEVGAVSYHCIKCGVSVHTRHLPISWGCSMNGFHSWIKNN